MAVKGWQALPGKVLLVTLNLFTAVALLFEGYNQGTLLHHLHLLNIRTQNSPIMQPQVSS
jgi:hypothetical protein